MQRLYSPQAPGALLFVVFLTLFLNHFACQTVQTTFPEYISPSGILAGSTFDKGASAGSYLSAVTKEGTFTWSLDQMPLRVYIEDGTGTPGYRSDYANYIRRAFNEWRTNSNSTITWREVNSPELANIICSWTAEARAKGNGVEAGETQTTIQRSAFLATGRIVRAHVLVLTYIFGHSLPDADVYKTCLHEIGHALGLQGHSSTTSDIMYPILNGNQTPYLRERDQNTIMALYAQSHENSSTAKRTFNESAVGSGASGYGANGYGASGYEARGYGARGYGASGYGASGYGASGYGASGYEAGSSALKRYGSGRQTTPTLVYGYRPLMPLGNGWMWCQH